MNKPADPAKAMGGSCAGGLLGAILGVIIGGAVGPLIAKSNNELKKNPDRSAQAYGDLLDPCLGAFGLIVGVLTGGIVGAVGGSVLGVGLATGGSASRSPSMRSDADRVAPPPPVSDTDELQRLRARVAELEARQGAGDTPQKKVPDNGDKSN